MRVRERMLKGRHGTGVVCVCVVEERSKRAARRHLLVLQ